MPDCRLKNGLIADRLKQWNQNPCSRHCADRLLTACLTPRNPLWKRLT